MNELSLLAINLTQRCNMRCAHCYLDAGQLCDGSDNELSTSEVRDILDQVASRDWGTMVVLTGGEPLLRHDLEEIVAHGAGRGLAMVIGTNGMALTDRRVVSLKRAGVLGVGISLDSLDGGYHDEFRGLAGSWQKSMAGIEACRRHDLSFQLHFSITEANADELPAMIDFARSCGARVLNTFFLVCTGRGESMSDISPLRYERVLAQIVSAQRECTDLIIRARCAPHFKRIAHQQNPDSSLNRISGQDGDGCIAGTRYCRITPEGGVTACPYIPDEEGNIRQQDFLDIWDNAPNFKRLRAPALRGKCGQCEYSQLCGGCRARPVAFGHDLMDEDVLCVYVPKNGAVLQPLSDAEHRDICWSSEAEQRLSRIPSFVRKMVKKRAEAYVAELGESEVTTAHLASLSARRFGGNMPAKPGFTGGAGPVSGCDCDVLVIGGGISGLANAWWLAREGLSVEVWESEERSGGKIMSSRSGGYLTERAAAMVLNFRPEVAELLHETGLEREKTARMSGAEAHRYLLHKGRLQALPMRLGGMLASPLWSPLGKLRLMLEPFILTAGAGDETVSSFVQRRFGREMLEKAMEPFVAGTLAADPELTSAAAALPRLTALEKRYGSVAAGILVNRILQRSTAATTETFSFRGGIGTLTDALSQSPHIRLHPGRRAVELVRKKNGWLATAETRSGSCSLQARQVVVATPSAAAAALTRPLDGKLAGLLQGITYAPVAVVHTGMERSAIGHPLDGTGFLAPRKEGRALTGNLWMSALFPGRAPAGKALLTSYLGGSRAPQVMEWHDERLVDEVLTTLEPLLGIKSAPEMVRIDRHSQALPVYHGAYQARMRAVEVQLKLLPGLHLEANYIGGVSVRDRLARGRALARKIVAEQGLAAAQTDNDSVEIAAGQKSGI